MPWILTSTIVPWVALPWLHTSFIPTLPQRATHRYGQICSVPARGARSWALTPIALSQWSANEQLRNRIGKKEERKKAGKQIARPQAGLLFCLLEFSTAGLWACVWLPSLAHFSRAFIDTHRNTLPLLNHNTPRDSSCYPRKSSAHSSRRAKKLKCECQAIFPQWGSHVATHPPCARQLHLFMLYMAHLFLNDFWQLYSNGGILLCKVMIACMCECEVNNHHKTTDMHHLLSFILYKRCLTFSVEYKIYIF